MINNLSIIIFLPLLAAYLVWLLPVKVKPLFAAVFSCLTLLAVLFLIPGVVKSKEVFFMKPVAGWLNLSFVIDGFALFFSVVYSFVLFLACLFLLRSIKAEEKEKGLLHWMLLFTGALLGLAFCGNMLLLLFFWELASVCCWMINRKGSEEKSGNSVDCAFILNLLGFVFIAAGLVFIYQYYSTFELKFLNGMMLASTPALLIFTGITLKILQLVVYARKFKEPVSSGVIPTAALLNTALLAIVGAYIFGRLFILTFAPNTLLLKVATVVSIIAMLSAASSAFVEDNTKKILAYSVICQIGFIILAFVINSRLSFNMALIYFLSFTLASSGIFTALALGEQRKDSIYPALAYLLAAFSMIGIPPFLGFWPKAITELTEIGTGNILIPALSIACSLFMLFFLFRLFNKVFLNKGEVKTKETREPVEVLVPLAFGVISVLLGVFIKIPLNFLASILR